MKNTTNDQFVMRPGLRNISLALAIIGFVALLISFKINPHVGWIDFLVSSLFVVTIAVSGLFFMSVTGIMQTSWLTPIKRIPEAMTKFLPVGFVLMLLTYFGFSSLYEWTNTEYVMNDPILKEKIGYLNVPFYLGRMIFIFLSWIIASAILRNLSLKMDKHGWTPEHIQKIIKASVISLAVFSLTICFAGFDWIMSIEPHWFSTIFGVYVFSGSFVSGIAFMILAVFVLQKWGYLEGFNENNFHDLGKWLFGFSTFWAYIWLSQYLLIWYANIPEETEYYVLREHVFGNGMVFGNVIINWVIPFMVLLPRAMKRNKNVLAALAVLALVGHFYDLYLMVAPNILHHHNISVAGAGSLQILQMVGFFSLLVLVVAKALSKHKLISVNDPNYAEGLHLHQ